MDLERYKAILDELVKRTKSFEDLVRDERINELWNVYLDDFTELLNEVFKKANLDKEAEDFMKHICKAFKSLEKFFKETMGAIEKGEKPKWSAGVYYIPEILIWDDTDFEKLKGVSSAQELKDSLDELVKAGKIDKNRIFILPRELSEFYKELGEALFSHFMLCFYIGANMGMDFGAGLTRYAIIFKMAELEKEIKNPADRFLALYLWLIREDKPDEIEKRIIKYLHRRGYSYRDIAKLCNRSLDTIHRILKNNN